MLCLIVFTVFYTCACTPWLECTHART